MNRDGYEDAKALQRATKALRKAPVPPGPPADALATVRALDGRVQPGGLAPPATSPTRRFPMRRVFSIAAAVLLFVGIAAVAYHLLGRTSVAFAEVRRQIEQAQTMKWHIQMQVTMPQQPGGVEVTCYYKAPGLMRQEAVVSKTGEKAITTIDFQTGRMLSLIPAQKQAIVIDIGQLPKAVRNKQVDFVANMKKLVQADAEELGFKTIDGQRLKGFRVKRGLEAMDVWVDPKTGTPAAMEMTLEGIGSMRMDGFLMGEELDDAIFSVVPPTGYEVTNFQMPLENPTEADLIAGLRWLAEHNDNTFPQTLAPTAKMIQKIQEQQTSSEHEDLSDQEQVQRALEITTPLVRMTMYVQMVKDFRYVGSGVTLGDGDRIVCRYKPAGSDTERIVYGDLRIEDAPTQPQEQSGDE